jgi:hypothetical protein
MAIHYCQDCDNYVDLDWDVEHYDECPLVTERKDEEAAAYWIHIPYRPSTPGRWQRLKCFLGFHGPFDVIDGRNWCKCQSCGHEGLIHGEFELI